MVVRTDLRQWPAALTAALVLLLGIVIASGIVVRARLGEPSAGAAGGPLPAPGQAGSAVVELSADARAYPGAAAVRALLHTYFDAVNSRDYPRWATTVVPDLAARQPETTWASDLAGTRDGTILVSRIEEADAGGGLLVLVSFATVAPVQNAADLPAGRSCWNASYSLVQEDGSLRLDSPRAGSVIRVSC